MQDDFSPNPEAPVLVVGTAGVDIVGRFKGELHMGTSNPAQIRSSFGGVGRNVAENLARLGQPVTLLTAVGEDQIGDQLLQGLASVGVDIQHVYRSDKEPTGSYLGVVNAVGELQFALDDMRVTHQLTPQHILEHADIFRNASAVFLDANLPKDTLRKTVSLARQAKIPICADPTTVTLAPKLRPYLKHMTIVTPNSLEAAVLINEPAEASHGRRAQQIAKQLVAQGVDVVIIALAEFGVCYATSATSGQIPAIRTNIVDPTGAGDALTATVLFGLLNSMSIDEAVRLGISAASLTLGSRGAVLQDLSLQKLYDHLVL